MIQMKRIIITMLMVFAFLVACGDGRTDTPESEEVEDVEDSVEETEVEEESVNSDEQEVEQIVGMIFELHGDDLYVTYYVVEDVVVFYSSRDDIINQKLVVKEA